MRIGYLVNQYPKVSHSFIRREILALESHGVDVRRFALRGWDADVVDPEDEREKTRTKYALRRGPLPLLPAALRHMARSPVRFFRALVLALRLSRRSDRPAIIHLVYLAEACLIADWLKRARIEHLHAHFGTNPAELACLVHILSGVGYSFTAHGPEEFDKPLALHLGEKIRRASFVVGVSSFGGSQLRRWVDTSQWAKIHVIRCGLDADYSGPETNLKISGNQLVCVGRLCEQKGQVLLVQAAAVLAHRGHQFSVVLAGDGEMRDEIEQLVSALNLGDKIKITGWINEDRVRSEILASRALVLPSFAEGLPVVIMEALALRRPVVSTFVAGIPELVRHGENGWLVPAGDVQQLADAMEDVLLAPDSTLAEMGNRGHERVALRHSVSREAGKLVELFRASIASR